MDYEKAFDSVDRETLWKLLRFYGIPEKSVTLIKSSYEGFTCRVAHEGQLSDSFEVRTGVQQGCLLSPFLFLLAIDWIMTSVTKSGDNGIQWTTWEQLDDLDYADDLALLSHNHLQMQDKTLKCPCDQKINSYFSLDFKTTLTKHYVTHVLSLDFKKTPLYFNCNFPI